MVKERDIFASIILSIVTCGLYGILWLIAVNDDLNLVSGSTDMGGISVAMLTIFTCGLYGFYWSFQSGKKVDALRQNRGLDSSNTNILYLILYFLFPLGGIIVCSLIQKELNNGIYTRELQ